MKHFALVMGVIFLLLFSSNNYCRSEEPTKSMTEQTVEEGKEEVKKAPAVEEQSKESAEAKKKKCDHDHAAETEKKEAK